MHMQDPLQKFPGEVNLVFSEAELDTLLKEDAKSLIVLMSTVTWCRPCKGMQKGVQVCLLLWHCYSRGRRTVNDFASTSAASPFLCHGHCHVA